jgi:uncharacterized membrane protein HdeD (DUF308 family)
MAVHTEQFHPLINKLAGLVAIILGFLIMASGYRYGSTGTIIIGIAIIVAGLAFLVLKIVRRNQGPL